jgi:hypothetical protein
MRYHWLPTSLTSRNLFRSYAFLFFKSRVRPVRLGLRSRRDG